ncbi:MAG: polyribonucleotide nucleotidyltransferase [Proteobacteria bacterium]|nr:polyribonucleotide nucleotidyltransferase [Pseudomonadota bacterium]MBU1716202.1 polyribonucleotide nucleotidyltransferase [Pseudomonadota bacterium]
MNKKVEVDIGGRMLSIETGRLAKQAGGAVLVTYGETVVLVTATAAKDAREEVDFLPLTVEYQERFYAVGKIPGSFFRREIGRPTEKETLTCRFIDRPLRPLFAEGYQNETQVIATVLSADKQNDPNMLAMIGASCSLGISNIPFLGPIAGVRVGFIDGEYVLNPTYDQQEKSRLDLIVAGTRKAVVMVEGGADSLSEEEILGGIFFGHESLQPILDIQEEMKAAVGKTKMVVVPKPVNEELQKKVAEIATGEMLKVISTLDKMERSEASQELQKKVVLEVGETFPDSVNEIKASFKELNKRMMRDRIVKDNARIDGRKMDEIRPISCEVGTLPRVHGSALFTRGETQAIVTATLGSSEDEQRVESLYGMDFNPFMLHYNFPPYCVGEVRFMRGPSRRDIGHGALATRAIQAVLPDRDKFPYTLRIVSEITESNGSSSMATVCGGSMALMDAGVPIKKPVAGVAMGLIKEDDKVIVLSDILGDEDHLGDMDFKVTGTDEGITALQMDIKIEGVSREIMTKALDQAKAGRVHILGEMQKGIAAHRPELPEHAPKIFSLQINPDKIRDLIGPGGKIIKGLSADYGVKIDVEDSGKVSIFAPDGQVGAKVTEAIKAITEEAEIGKIYKGIVQKIVDFGAFVEIMPGTDGLIHISELDNKRVENVTDVLKEGDEVMVKVLNVDQRGKIRLSRKAVLNESDS